MGSSQSTPAASNMYTATAASDVAAAAATALTLHPTSDLKGQHFDRYVQIFFENQDYAIAEGDPNFAYLATLGIKLDNYWSITHPSQPNYVAALGADKNGVILDNFVQIDESVETVIDLLEAGGVSWSIYGEDQPYSGFEGDWVNQETGANMYVRKHNVSFFAFFMSSDPIPEALILDAAHDELQFGNRGCQQASQVEELDRLLRRTCQQQPATVDLGHTKYDLRWPRQLHHSRGGVGKEFHGATPIESKFQHR